MDIGVKGRRAVVCGGSKGISFAAARRLSLEGAEVVIVARSEDTLKAAGKAIANESGTSVEHFSADLTSPNDRSALVAAHPACDILVTNSGVPQRPIPYQELTRDEWDRWFDAHFFSAIDLIHAYAPGMCDRRFGRIVNLSANFIKFPQVGVGHSHAARLALAGAIASLVREVAPYNVTINSVLPGLINTEALQSTLARRAAASGVRYEDVAGEVRARTASQRIAEPQEAGDLIAMLCAEQMGYVTGQNIVNDGGSYQGLF